MRKFLLQSNVNLPCCKQLGPFCSISSTMNLRWSFPLQLLMYLESCHSLQCRYLRQVMTSSNNLHISETLPNSGRTSSSTLLVTSEQLLICFCAWGSLFLVLHFPLTLPHNVPMSDSTFHLNSLCITSFMNY